jgi:hypothetical protein
MRDRPLSIHAFGGQRTARPTSFVPLSVWCIIPHSTLNKPVARHDSTVTGIFHQQVMRLKFLTLVVPPSGPMEEINCQRFKQHW